MPTDGKPKPQRDKNTSAHAYEVQKKRVVGAHSLGDEADRVARNAGLRANPTIQPIRRGKPGGMI